MHQPRELEAVPIPINSFRLPRLSDPHGPPRPSGASLERALGEDADGSTESAACYEAGAEVRIGLVSMLKKPSNFESWLNYYRDVIGVERFYLKARHATHEGCCACCTLCASDCICDCSCRCDGDERSVGGD